MPALPYNAPVPAAAEPSEPSPKSAAAGPSEADVRFNFRLLLIHGMLGQTGFRLLGAPTFLPTYLSLLAGNNSVVGIARAVHSLGMSLSPYIGAWMVEHRKRVKRLAILFGGAMLRIYTREFMRNLLTGSVELIEPRFVGIVSPPLCR